MEKTNLGPKTTKFLKMIRTHEQILDRFNEVEDMFVVQKADLIKYLPFELAKPFLTDEYLAKIASKETIWKQYDDPIAEIKEYLPFAFNKANNQRGLSARRSLLHLKTWI